MMKFDCEVPLLFSLSEVYFRELSILSTFGRNESISFPSVSLILGMVSYFCQALTVLRGVAPGCQSGNGIDKCLCIKWIHVLPDFCVQVNLVLLTIITLNVQTLTKLIGSLVAEVTLKVRLR